MAYLVCMVAFYSLSPSLKLDVLGGRRKPGTVVHAPAAAAAEAPARSAAPAHEGGQAVARAGASSAPVLPPMPPGMAPSAFPLRPVVPITRESLPYLGQLELDDLLVHIREHEVIGLPSCDDADLGYGHNATLRQALARSRWAGANGLSPALFGVDGSEPFPPVEPALEAQLATLRAGSRVFVAALLHQNEKALALWSRELLKLLLAIGAVEGERAAANTYVSILESNSADLTAPMVLALMQLLRALNVRAESLSGHTGPRPTGRIAYLSHLRNVALRPLLRMAADPSERPFSHVLYLNDVFYCARGVVEMLWHVRATPRAAAADDARDGDGGDGAGAGAGGGGGGGGGGGDGDGAPYAYAADMSCSVDYTSGLNLYDKWAGHDILGFALLNTEPFARHGPSSAAYGRAEPFQVTTCWNGMAAFRADAVVDKGLRFRRAVPLECAASECDLFCRDMWSVGFGRIVMVPRNKVAYSLQHFAMVRATLRAEGGAALRWSTAAVEIGWRAEAPAMLECCPIGNASAAHKVDWRECISELDWAHRYALFGTPAAADRAALRVSSPLGSALGAKGATVADMLALFSARVRAWPADAAEARARLRPLLGGGGLVEAARELFKAHAACAEAEAAEGGAASVEVGGGAARLARLAPAAAAAASASIPLRILQVGPSEALAELPISALWSIFAWRLRHPCVPYEYTSVARAVAELGHAYPRLADVARAHAYAPQLLEASAPYLVAYARGGAYASLHTAPTRSVEALLRLGAAAEADGSAADAFVFVEAAVGAAGAAAAADGGAAVPAVWAAAAGHAALANLLATALDDGATPTRRPITRGGRVGAGVAQPLTLAELHAEACTSGARAFATVALAQRGRAGVRSVREPGVVGRIGEEREVLLLAARPARSPAVPHVLLLVDEPALTHGYARARAAGYDRLPSAADGLPARSVGLPARSFVYGVSAAARESAYEPLWTIERWLTPVQRDRVRAYARAQREGGGEGGGGGGCYAELGGDGALAVYAGRDPTARVAGAVPAANGFLYELRRPLAKPLAWPAVPVLALSDGGALSLHVHEYCEGPCEGGRTPAALFPPAGIDRFRVAYALNVSARGPLTTAEDPMAQWACARHVLTLGAEDALLRVHCDEEPLRRGGRG